MTTNKGRFGVKVHLSHTIFVIIVLGLLSGCSNRTLATPSMTIASPVVPTITSLSITPTFATNTPQAPATTPPLHPLETQPTVSDPRSELQSGIYLVFWMDGLLYLSSLEQPLGVRLASVDYPFARSSPDGGRLAFSSKGELMLYEMASGKVTKLSGLQKGNSQPSWSPDGKSLVYTHNDEELVDSSLYVVNVKDNNPIRITSWPTIERAPAWSPDGKWIAFASDHAKINRTDGTYLGVTEIYLLDTGCLAEPTSCVNEITQITDMGTDGDSDGPSWSSDGKQLLFMCGSLLSDGNYQKDICSIRVDGSELKKITNTPENELWPMWSPDGKIHRVYT